MASLHLNYQLSLEADKDLEDIFDYTVERFSVQQAVKYLTRLEEVFVKLCNNPEMGRKRDEIRKNLRSISYESHTIFYRIMKDHIRIVRVLHSSRDIIKFLPPKE